MTSIETGPTWLERLNPRNWTLVWKLVIVGLAPALLALTLGALRISDQAGAAADLGASNRLLDVRSDVSAASDALRTEGYQASLFAAGGRTGDRVSLQTAEAQSDSAIAVVQTATSSAELDQSASVAAAQAANELTRLTGLRSQVTDNPAFALAQIRSSYNQITEGVDVLDRVLLREIRVPETGGQVDALSAAQVVKAQLAVQHGLIGDAIRSKSLQPGDRNDIDATDVEIFAQYRTYQLSLTPQQLQRYGTFLDDPANSRRQELATAVLNAPVDQPFPLTAADWDAAYAGSAGAVDKSADAIRQDVKAAGTAAEQQASNLAGINSVILMLGLLVGITIAVLVARSLIRSLRVLRGAALDVAERRLPDVVSSMRAGETPDVTVDPVPIHTHDEVGQVARAFDAVHGQAVRLAADQAALQSNVSAMFVNLSRRSQALVERQLQLIEQLESNEQDADQLSNLFQLDHLATRMRRNSENLLVLAGTDLAKRNIAPVPMVDVLRAAVSEVEQYQRVVVQAPPTVAILGRAGSDLVHLLAELLDNATNFSPPDSQVVMSTARTPDGTIVVEIADRGVGMADHELSDANQRLSGPATVDVSASRRMGLFVVGRLAARHGIDVRLAGAIGHGPGAGLTASVTVPAYLVPKSMSVEVGRPVGVSLSAGLPSQAGPSVGEIPMPRPDTTAGRGGSLAALATGEPAPAAERPAEPRGGDGLFSGRPAANGAANGLPTRMPGSSLRPDGPGGGPGGPPRRGEDAFASDGPGGPAEPADRSRQVAEQARRDQEAAARRDRRDRDGAGTAAVNGRTPAPRPPAANDERPAVENGVEGGPTALASPEQDSRSSSAPSATTPMPVVTNRPPATQPTLPKRPTPRPAEPPAAEAAPPPAPTGDIRAADAPVFDVPAPDVPVVDVPTEEPAVAAELAETPPPAGPLPRRRPSAPQADEPTFAAAGAPPAPTTVPSHRVSPLAPIDEFADPWPAPRAAVPPQPAPVAEPAGAPDSSTPSGSPELPDSPELSDGPELPDSAASPGTSTGWSDGSDALFAPSVPNLGGRDAEFDPQGFDSGESTPIFEEIASAWFRSNRPVPVSWQTEPGAAAPPVAHDSDAPAPAPDTDVPAATVAPVADPAVGAPAAPVPPRPYPAAAPPAAVRPAAAPPVTTSTDPAPYGAPAVHPAPVRPAGPARPVIPAQAPRPTAPAVSIADAAAFSTAADEGWRAARGAEVDSADELTAAGLPKRRPRARLVPGSAGAAVLAQPVSAARSAENIRGRLSSYQQGVRQGRETRLRSTADDGPEPGYPGPDLPDPDFTDSHFTDSTVQDEES